MEEEKKIKVLFISDLVVETGFSTVAHNIIKNLKESGEFDITGLGVNYNGDPHDFDFPIYPARSQMGGNIYGLDRAVNLLLSFDYDLVFILNDSWIISYYLDMFKKHVTKERLPKIVVYFPVDSRGHNPDWYRDFDIVSQAVTYTEFGKKVVEIAAPKLDVRIIPHGVESADFYKIWESRAEARLKLFGPEKLAKFGDPEKLFIALNANRNQPRKKLDITFAGFSIFARNKPEEVKLYMHSGLADAHVNLVYESRRYGIESRLILSTDKPGIMRLPVDRLNLIYNACDVGINTSLGEGWGLTNVEHAVTGAVQIVPRHSSCEEIFHDCGLLMETVTDWTFDSSETVGKLTTPQELARCLEILYRDPDLRKELSERSMKKFLQPKYQWKVISETWKELFIEVTKKDATPISNEHEGDNRTDN
jgi:glycosyltransferase involved in cell wall biosynthesis